MRGKSIRILLVEDSRTDAELIVEMLSQAKAAKFDVTHVPRLHEGLEHLRAEPFDAVILDLNLPDSYGMDTFVQARVRVPDVPILILTGFTDEEFGIQAVQEGAQDYLIKGQVDGHLIAKSILYAIERYRFMALLRGLSIIDELTGLYNRRHMVKLVEDEFQRALRYGTDLSCLMIDLDLFKEVNDNFGHEFGDMVLKEFGALIKKHTRISDSCFRYGGEEFMVLLPQTDFAGAVIRAEGIRELCETREYSDGTNTAKVTVSIGIASMDRHRPCQAKEILAYADKALYRAKAEGRNRVAVYLEGDSSCLQTFDSDDASELYHLRERLSAILDKTKRAAISSLELLVKDMADPQPQLYRRNVRQYLELLGSRLNLPATIIDTLKRAASLHDCFSVLLAQQLREGDGASDFQDHPYLMAELSQIFDFFSNERAVLLYHHENFDGSGFPEGLEGNGIPLGARIFAIADALASLTSCEGRENGMGRRIEEEFSDKAGTRYDPLLIRLLLGAMEEIGLWQRQGLK